MCPPCKKILPRRRRHSSQLLLSTKLKPNNSLQPGPVQKAAQLKFLPRHPLRLSPLLM
jgi:hypothetical protein